MDEDYPVNEALCQQIRDAFAGVTLGNGIGLWEAQGIDNYEDEATCARYRETDEKDDWSRIPVEALNRCNSSPSFFDAEGMRFHLPAFLIADLQGLFDFDLDYYLIHGSVGDLTKRFALFSPDQRKVVRAYLAELLQDEWMNTHLPAYQKRIHRALETYWTE